MSFSLKTVILQNKKKSVLNTCFIFSFLFGICCCRLVKQHVDISFLLFIWFIQKLCVVNATSLSVWVINTVYNLSSLFYFIFALSIHALLRFSPPKPRRDNCNHNRIYLNRFCTQTENVIKSHFASKTTVC